LISAQIGALTFGPSSKFDYTLSVDVKDLQAKGSAHLEIRGAGDSKKTTVSGDVSITDMVSEQIPLGCTTACNSAIPVFFIGTVNAKVTTEDSKPQQIQTGILLESPYFNPWGGPLSIVSTDSPTTPSIVIVTTYDKATIDWTSSMVGGALTGTLGKSAVSGTFTLVSHETENLVTGKAIDDGTMTFSNMTPSTLNVNGKFSGTSFIPQPNTPACALEMGIFGVPCTQDCTSTFALFGLPAIPGTCTSTGFQSSGKMSLSANQQDQNQGNDEGQQGGNHQDISVDGTYSTTWMQPALAFLSTATATVTKQ
jgi:hypothetical protein